MKVIKITNKSDKDDVWMNEVNILGKMDYPHIVKIHNFYITSTNIYY